VTGSSAVVTGAYGYLGSVIRGCLDAAGWVTTALVRTPRPEDRAVRWSLGERPSAELLAGADALVHCAYDFRVRSSSEVRRVNVDGTATLLEVARRAGVERILVLSSMSAYEGTRQIYGQAKLAIEEVTYRSGGIAVRPGLVYGAEPGGTVGAMLRLLHLPIVPMIGGSARQFPLYDRDLGAAVVEILEAPDWRPEVFGLAQPVSVSFAEFVRLLAHRQGHSPRLVPVPWRAVYWVLRLAEATGVSLPLRADSVLGLVRPAHSVIRSSAFPDLLDRLSTLPSDATGRA
jgi:nucleoside-diphosphate-sugar epimerase